MTEELETQIEVAPDHESKRSTLTRRSVLGGAALALTGAALAACSTNSSADQTGTGATTTSLLKKIQDRGQLNVTTSLLYPPEFFKDSSGKPAGYDIDVLNMVAKDLNVKLNIIDVPDNAANIANVQSGKADLVSAGLVNTPKRALVMNFTKGYVPYTQILMVTVNGGINSVADLNKPGKKITALQASTAFFRAQLLFPKATVTPLAQDQALLSVATGKADACLVEDYLAKPFIAQHSNVKLMNNGQGVATEFGCWGVIAGDYLWWRWLDNWISYNIDNAQLPGMYTNTFGLPPAARGSSMRKSRDSCSCVRSGSGMRRVRSIVSAVATIVAPRPCALATGSCRSWLSMRVPLRRSGAMLSTGVRVVQGTIRCACRRSYRRGRSRFLRGRGPRRIRGRLHTRAARRTPCAG